MRIRRANAAFTGAAIASSPPVRQTRVNLALLARLLLFFVVFFRPPFCAQSEDKQESSGGEGGRGCKNNKGKRRRRIQSPLMVSVSDVWRAIAEAEAHECALAEKEGRKEKKGKGRRLLLRAREHWLHRRFPELQQLQRPQSPAPLQPPAACWATLPPSVTRHSSWRRVVGGGGSC